MRSIVLGALLSFAAQPELRDLLTDLRSPLPSARRAATEKLIRIGPSVAPPAHALLKDKDANVRRAAVDVLAGLAFKHAEAVPLLATALEHEDRAVRHAAAAGLNEAVTLDEKAVRLLARALEDKEDDVLRRLCLLALERAGPRAAPAVPILLDTLDDEDRGLAASAWKTLEAAKHDPRPLLRKRLEEIDPEMRLAAARAFIDLARDRDTPTPALLEILDGKSLRPRLRAAFLLAQSGSADRRLRDALAWMAYLEDDDLRGEAFDAVGVLVQRDPESAPLLVPFFADPRHSRRIEAVDLVRALKEKGKALQPLVLERLSDPVVEVRLQALTTLQAQRAEPAVCLAAFCDLLADERVAARVVDQFARLEGPSTWLETMVLAASADRRAGVRYHTVQMCRAPAAAGKKVLERLEQLACTDEDGKVRYEAVQSLLRIGRPALANVVHCLRSADGRVRDRAAYVTNSAWADKEETAKLLAEMLDDKLTHARRAAAWRLSEMGAGARAAAPALRKHARDEDEEVRGYVAKALKALDGSR